MLFSKCKGQFWSCDLQVSLNKAKLVERKANAATSWTDADRATSNKNVSYLAAGGLNSVNKCQKKLFKKCGAKCRALIRVVLASGESHQRCVDILFQ